MLCSLDSLSYLAVDNQTWGAGKWTISIHFSMIFLLKPPFIRDFSMIFPAKNHLHSLRQAWAAEKTKARGQSREASWWPSRPRRRGLAQVFMVFPMEVGSTTTSVHGEKYGETCAAAFFRLGMKFDGKLAGIFVGFWRCREWHGRDRFVEVGCSSWRQSCEL